MKTQNLKLLFTFLSFSIFTITGMMAQTDSNVEGDLNVTGEITAQSGIYNFQENYSLYSGGGNGLFNLRSDHLNVSQLRFINSRGRTVGRIYATTNNVGIMDANSRWVLRSHPTFMSLRVANDTKMHIASNGKINIGNVDTSPDGYKLFVEDGILAEKVRVALDGEDDWADYVFEDDYELMPLEEVNTFIEKNNHLPNVPSAEDMVESGLDVLESDAILLRKIEEAYLYIIEQNEKIAQQNERIAKLEEQVD